MRKTYQNDLSNEECSYIEPHLPAPDAPARLSLHALGEVLDAIFYIVCSACACGLLAHDFPPWNAVCHYLRTWRKDGTWARLHAASLERLRVRLKRDPQPSADVVASQSAKMTAVGISAVTIGARRSQGP